MAVVNEISPKNHTTSPAFNKQVSKLVIELAKMKENFCRAVEHTEKL